MAKIMEGKNHYSFGIRCAFRLFCLILIIAYLIKEMDNDIVLDY